MAVEPVLVQRLTAALRDVARVIEEDDGSLTVFHDGAVASLRVVMIADGLDMVALTQLLASDLPLADELRHRVAEQAARTVLGTVALVEKPDCGAADVVLRYNFPATDLAGDALRMLVLLVLSGGKDAGAAVKG